MIMERKYPVQNNKVAFLRINDEPVFVKSVDGEKIVATHVRNHPDKGLIFDTITFEREEVYSPQQRIFEQMQETLFEATMRAEFSQIYEKAMTNLQKRAKEANKEEMGAVKQADGEPYLN